MCGKIKSSEFVKFDFWTSANVQTDLECSCAFKSQHPIGTDEKILAIMVLFDATSPEDVFHFNAQCRVVFDFTSEDKLPTGDDLIAKNYREAYQVFCEKANEAFEVLGQNRFEFHEID